MKILSYLFISLTLIIGCKSEKKSPIAENVRGKMVDNIEHYTIHFTDGAMFDMNEKTAHKIYYLVRHAEKDTVPIGDPNLTSDGLARANRLSNIFQNTQLDAIYSTLTTRTLYTVDSLADSKGMVTFPYEAKDFKDLATELTNSLEKHRILVVGHSNTTPVLANHLYGEQYFNKTIDENEYDNLFVIIQHSDSTNQLLELKY